MTGDSISGVEAVAEGWANRAFPADSLDDEVLKIAERITKTPSDLTQLNKRVVHRQMEIMGLRTGMGWYRLCALGIHTESMQQFIGKIQDKGLTKALTERDGEYGITEQVNNESLGADGPLGCFFSTK